MDRLALLKKSNRFHQLLNKISNQNFFNEIIISLIEISKINILEGLRKLLEITGLASM